MSLDAFEMRGISFRFRRVLTRLEMYSSGLANQLLHVSAIECGARQLADEADYASVINDEPQWIVVRSETVHRLG